MKDILQKAVPTKSWNSNDQDVGSLRIGRRGNLGDLGDLRVLEDQRADPPDWSIWAIWAILVNWATSIMTHWIPFIYWLLPCSSFCPAPALLPCPAPSPSPVLLLPTCLPAPALFLLLPCSCSIPASFLLLLLPTSVWQPSSSSAPCNFFRYGKSHLLWYQWPLLASGHIFFIL